MTRKRGFGSSRGLILLIELLLVEVSDEEQGPSSLILSSSILRLENSKSERKFLISGEEREELEDKLKQSSSISISESSPSSSSSVLKKQLFDEELRFADGRRHFCTLVFDCGLCFWVLPEMGLMGCRFFRFCTTVELSMTSVKALKRHEDGNKRENR